MTPEPSPERSGVRSSGPLFATLTLLCAVACALTSCLARPASAGEIEDQCARESLQERLSESRRMVLFVEEAAVGLAGEALVDVVEGISFQAGGAPHSVADALGADVTVVGIDPSVVPVAGALGPQGVLEAQLAALVDRRGRRLFSDVVGPASVTSDGDCEALDLRGCPTAPGRLFAVGLVAQGAARTDLSLSLRQALDAQVANLVAPGGVRDPQVLDLARRELAVIFADAEVALELNPELVDAIEELTLAGRAAPLFREVLTETDVERWVSFHADRERRLERYQAVRAPSLDTRSKRARLQTLERYDACVKAGYGRRLQRFETGQLDVLRVWRAAGGVVRLELEPRPDPAGGSSRVAGSASFSLAELRQGDTGTLRAALLRLFPEADAEPLLLAVSFQQLTEVGSLRSVRRASEPPRPVLALTDLDLHVRVEELRDEEDLDRERYTWTLDDRGLAARGPEVVVPAEVLEELSRRGGDHPVTLAVRIEDANRSGGRAPVFALDILPTPRVTLHADSAPVQLIGGGLTHGPVGGRNRVYRGFLRQATLLPAPHLSITSPALPAEAEATWIWRQLGGPRLSCEALPYRRCSESDGVIVETTSPELLLHTHRPGAYRFEVQELVDLDPGPGQTGDVLPSQPLELSTVAAFHRTTVGDGSKLTYVTGYRRVTGSSLPFIGGAAGLQPGAQLRLAWSPQLELRGPRTEGELEEDVIAGVFAVGLDLHLVDAVMAHLDPPNAAGAPRNTRSVARRVDVDIYLQGEWRPAIPTVRQLLAKEGEADSTQTVALPVEDSSSLDDRLADLDDFLFQAGPAFRFSSWELVPTLVLRPTAEAEDTVGLLSVNAGFGLHYAYHFGSTGQVDPDRVIDNDLLMAQRDHVLRQPAFRCRRQDKGTIIRCTALRATNRPFPRLLGRFWDRDNQLSHFEVRARVYADPGADVVSGPLAVAVRPASALPGRRGDRDSYLLGWPPPEDLGDSQAAAVREALRDVLVTSYPLLEVCAVDTLGTEACPSLLGPPPPADQPRPDRVYFGLDPDGESIAVFTGSYLSEEGRRRRWCSRRKPPEPGGGASPSWITRRGVCNGSLDVRLAEAYATALAREEREPH